MIWRSWVWAPVGSNLGCVELLSKSNFIQQCIFMYWHGTPTWLLCFLSSATNVSHTKLEALRECRPPWPRQIITPILPTVKILSLGGKRLTPLKTKQNKTKKKGFGLLPAPQSGYATAIMVFVAHLLILEYSDHHQNIIISSLFYPVPFHKISLQSIHNFLSNVVHRQTYRETNQRYQKHNLLCQGGKYPSILVDSYIPYLWPPVFP